MTHFEVWTFVIVASVLGGLVNGWFIAKLDPKSRSNPLRHFLIALPLQVEFAFAVTGFLSVLQSLGLVIHE